MAKPDEMLLDVDAMVEKNPELYKNLKQKMKAPELHQKKVKGKRQIFTVSRIKKADIPKEKMTAMLEYQYLE